MTNEQAETIVRMYINGDAIINIAKAVDRNENTVKHWIRYNRDAYGLKHRRNRPDRNGAVATSDQTDKAWNVKLSKQYITKPWGSAA